MREFTMKFKFIRASLLLAPVLLCSSAAAAKPTVQEEQFGFEKLKFARLTLRDGDAPPVRYYLSTPAQKAPLVLCIQGSGCTPPFIGLETANRQSTIYSWIPLAIEKRYAVMAVDKPYQSDEPQNGERGSAIGCAGEFNGPTQLYDFAANIYRSNGSDEEKLRQLQEVDATFTAIRADPASGSKFAWGHPYLRWSSFFAGSPAENLAHAKARVYLASGMQDRNVPILSTEVMYAQLRAQGRDVTFRRVPSGGHDLAPEGRPIPEAQKEFDSFMAWFDRR